MLNWQCGVSVLSFSVSLVVGLMSSCCVNKQRPVWVMSGVSVGSCAVERSQLFKEQRLSNRVDSSNVVLTKVEPCRLQPLKRALMLAVLKWVR